jgi:hypothetical protein
MFLRLSKRLRFSPHTKPVHRDRDPLDVCFLLFILHLIRYLYCSSRLRHPYPVLSWGTPQLRDIHI